MRNIYIGMATATVALVGLASCDDIKEQDRFIPVEREHSAKVVLLEEFTGARCVNCPNGAAEVHKILESDRFKDNVVAVSLYPSQLTSLTAPTNVDLRTDAASEYFSTYDGTTKGLPGAMFDRTSYNGSVIQLDVASWGTFVDQATKEVPPLDITLAGEYDAASRKLDVDYKISFVDPVLDEVCVQLWLIENGIISFQYSTTGLIPDYENNHVLRAAINGTWGESIGIGHTPEQIVEGSSSITLKSDWKAENVQVVGFVYRASDRHVLQAHLLKSITE